jgi:multicomponent Na+:H+ antiporter subunit C
MVIVLSINMFKIGYIIFAFSVSVGLFGIFYWNDYFRKIISFAVFSNSSIILFVTLAYKQNSLAPIYTGTPPEGVIFTDPIPSVLMLTAIVVGISLQSIALSLYSSISKKSRATNLE